MNTSDLNTMTIVDRINNVSDNTNLTGTDDDVVLAKIEVSSICKFNCLFCSRQYIRSNDPDRLDKNMDLDRLKSIITTLKSRYKNLKEIGLFYMGESGFNPNLKEMYKYLKDNGYFTFLTTNASYIKYILEAIPYIDSLKVSWNYTDIDDFNKKTNASYKYQDFMDLIDNIDKLYQLKTQLWNEALTYLGISNVNVQKKERLITDEVMRNQGGTIASRYSRLESRRQACYEINKKFGLDIWCDYREDYQSIDPTNDTINGEPNSDGEGGVVGE